MGLDGWFLWFILFWVVVLISLMGIGGFFMFRKFLKAMPKQDGKSDLDWQNIYLDKTIHLWGEEEKNYLPSLSILCQSYSVKSQKKRLPVKSVKLH